MSHIVLDRGGRQSGKTTRALLWALGDPARRVVIVPLFVMKRVLADLLVQMGHLPDAVEIWTWGDYVSGRNSRSDREFWIDEIDMCLPGNVVGMSGL